MSAAITVSHVPHHNSPPNGSLLLLIHLFPLLLLQHLHLPPPRRLLRSLPVAPCHLSIQQLLRLSPQLSPLLRDGYLRAQGDLGRVRLLLGGLLALLGHPLKDLVVEPSPVLGGGDVGPHK